MDRPTLLFAEDLRFRKDWPAEFHVPISINGDEGRCEFACRFPQRSGIVESSWTSSPRLEIAAADSAYPGDEMTAIVRARGFEETKSLMLTITDDSGDSSHVLWRKVLPSPRRSESRFQNGSKDSTLQIIASEYDWEVAIPTQFGTGVHWLNVQSVDPIGTSFVEAKHRLILDKGLPSEVRARAEVAKQHTDLRITMQPSLSGVHSVVAEPVIVTKESKVRPLPADALADDGSRWGLAWPKGLALPEQIRLTITTGAGQSYETKCDLPVQQIRAMGTVSGRVLEGSIPQPRTTVAVLNEQGAIVSKERTGDGGRFQLRLPAGKYRLKAQKTSTNRQAEVPIRVGENQTRQVDLRLLRSAS